MKEVYSVIEIRIKLDPIPGWGNNPQDHVKFLQSELANRIPWYNPTVKLIRVEEVINETNMQG